MARNLSRKLLCLCGDLPTEIRDLCLQCFSVHVRSIVVLLLGWAILKEEADLFVLLNQVLLAWKVVGAGWAVLVDVLRAEAVDRVRSEPGTGKALRAILVGVRLSAIRLASQAELGNDILQQHSVEQDVGKERQCTCSNHLVSFHAEVSRLAVGLEDEAGQHAAARDSHQPLRPPVHHLVCVVAGLDGPKDAVVVEGVDVQVGHGHAKEHLNVEATWEEEDEHGDHCIQHQVGIT
mmetsp:Transcript_68715/g.161053  ORF Transcript_68715/g.161053 Transcript_68715/m.161053 type:complete len:235 (-) Transcript_68715:2214-2918(-)